MFARAIVCCKSLGGSTAKVYVHRGWTLGGDRRRFYDVGSELNIHVYEEPVLRRLQIARERMVPPFMNMALVLIRPDRYD